MVQPAFSISRIWFGFSVPTCPYSCQLSFTAVDRYAYNPQPQYRNWCSTTCCPTTRICVTIISWGSECFTKGCYTERGGSYQDCYRNVVVPAHCLQHIMATIEAQDGRGNAEKEGNIGYGISQRLKSRQSHGGTTTRFARGA
jgi:hypothetical protein